MQKGKTVENKNIEIIKKSFTAQASNFDNKNMNFSKQEYLDYTVNCVKFSPNDIVLDAACGTCACGCAIAGCVKKVVCLDATQAMLDVGRRKAEERNLTNMEFVIGEVENLPFENIFDAVITRLAFHHFPDIEKPFSEMNRVLKNSGKLVIIDMLAAEEDLREREDEIETMRDPSHVRNISYNEFKALYDKYGFDIIKKEVTKIPVSFKAWMDLTKTPDNIKTKIETIMKQERSGLDKTGFNPYLKKDEIFFDQRWLMLIGVKK